MYSGLSGHLPLKIFVELYRNFPKFRLKIEISLIKFIYNVTKDNITLKELRLKPKKELSIKSEET